MNIRPTRPPCQGRQAVDIKRILQIIPHRIRCSWSIAWSTGGSTTAAVGIKNVSINEPFFQGHFPSEPVMPGVLIVEAMAQTAAVLVVATSARSRRASWSISCRSTACRFRRPVVPGDRLELHVEKVQSRPCLEFSGKAMSRARSRRKRPSPHDPRPGNHREGQMPDTAANYRMLHTMIPGEGYRQGRSPSIPADGA